MLCSYFVDKVFRVSCSDEESGERSRITVCIPLLPVSAVGINKNDESNLNIGFARHSEAMKPMLEAL